MIKTAVLIPTAQDRHPCDPAFALDLHAVICRPIQCRQHQAVSDMIEVDVPSGWHLTGETFGLGLKLTRGRFGAEADMNFASSDWNIGLSLLLCKSGAYSTFISLTQTVVTFAIDGPVCNALVKLIGPRYTLSATFLGVAVTILGMGFATNRAEWFALRLCEWSRGRPLQCRGRLGQY